MATERSVMVRLRADASQFDREMLKARAAVSGVRDEIDTTNDRAAWLAQGFLALAPALVPIGAAAIPVLAGIATQATVAVGAIGTMALAFHGLGDGLKALNAYQLDPTAENLKKLQLTMEKLGPEGAEFVRFLDDAGEQLSILQTDARQGMFPGMEQGISNALRLLPQLREIVKDISTGIGDLSIEAGKGIAGPEFEAFFNYLQRDAKPLLEDMGHTLGNFIDGFASMLTAFGPLTRDFSGGLLEMSRSFEQWAEGLRSSATFYEFVNYIRDAGPKTIDLIGAIAGALVQLVEAAAPIGSAALPVLTQFFNILGAIADTPVGSFLVLTAALTSMYGRVKALQSITTGGVMGGLTKGFRDSGTAARAAIPSLEQWRLALLNAARSQKQLKENIMKGSKSYAVASARASSAKFAVSEFARAAAPAAAAGGLLALSMSGVAEKAGFGNSVMGATVGLMATGGPWGAAIGGGIGLLADIKSAEDDWTASIEAANRAIKSQDLKAMRLSLQQLKDDLDFRESGTDWGSIGSIFANIKSDIGDTFSGDWLGTEHIDEDREKIEGLGSAMEFTRAMSAKGWDTNGVELLYRGLGYTADEADRAATSVGDFRREVERAMGILSQQEAFDAFQGAIDAATKSIKDNGETLDNNTEKGRNNRAALRDVAKTALEAAEGLKGLQRNNYVEGAADQFIKIAKAMGMGEDAAKRWAARLFDLDKVHANPHVDVDDKKARAKVKRILDDMGYLDGTTGSPSVDLLIQQFLKSKVSVEQMLRFLNGLKANPHVGADTAEAITKIHGVISAMSSIHDKVVHIQTVFSRNNLDVDKGADGTTVPKTGLPYADRHLYLLADGERVTSNRHGQVDKSERLLDLINQGRLNDRMMGLADGGTAGGSQVTYRGDVPATRGGDNAAEREARKTAGALKGLQAELKRATTALEREGKERDRLLDKMKSVGSATQDGLRSSLFDQDVWSGTSGVGILRGDIRDIRAEKNAIQELEDKGVTGAALAEILAEGGLAGAQQYASMSRADLREYVELYDQRNRALRSVGELAGRASYGSALRVQQEALAEARQTRKELSHRIERVEKAIHREHGHDRQSTRRGAGNAARNRRRD